MLKISAVNSAVNASPLLRNLDIQNSLAVVHDDHILGKGKQKTKSKANPK